LTAKNTSKKKDGNEAGKLTGMSLGDLGDLAGLLTKSQTTDDNLKLQEISLDLIDEDPNQPRREDNPGFSVENLEELASTIRLRGVKSPISVRVNPAVDGRYLINHGARRYRASKLANKNTIPAFIDNDYNKADQVIENLQRDELTAREIADFIGRELARNKKKIAIAKEIGKSPAFITQHATLLDLPEPIAKAFNSGRCKDVTVINELVTAYKQNLHAVTDWLVDGKQEITRGSVKLLREFIEDKRNLEDSKKDLQNDEAAKKKLSKTSDPDKLKKAIIQVSHDNRAAQLILNRRPPREGWAWFKYEDNNQEFKAKLSTVQLVALLEG